MTAIPKIISGTFELPSGKVVEVGSTAWFKWLDLSETRSFRFDDGEFGFTARKEKVKGQDGYWYAYASVLGKTRKKYLGKSESLTQEKMIKVEQQLHNSENVTQTQAALPKKALGKAFNKSASAENFDIEGLKTEILAELRAELHRELGKANLQESNLSEWESDRLKMVRESLRPDAETENTARLKAANQRIAELEEEATGWYQKHCDAQALADRLQAELDEARSQLATVTETVTKQSVLTCEEKLDYEALASVALASLKLGKQAPGYKAAAKALAKFRELL